MEKESQIIIFETQDKSISLPVMIADESAWINRNQMAELFGRDVKTIGKHINNALREELSDENAVVAKFATTAADGKTYMTEHYNLNVHDRRVKSGRKRNDDQRDHELSPLSCKKKQNDGAIVARTHITGI